MPMSYSNLVEPYGIKVGKRVIWKHSFYQLSKIQRVYLVLLANYGRGMTAEEIREKGFLDFSSSTKVALCCLRRQGYIYRENGQYFVLSFTRPMNVRRRDQEAYVAREHRVA